MAATDHASDVARYVSGILDGSIVAGSLVKAACRRHLADLEHGEERGLWFDEASAIRAIQFFCCLSHTTGEYAGQPFIPRVWQKFIIWNLFGWRRDDGFRRFRKAFISLARGNGKALALDTPIPTPSGWSTMGDLRVGDRVFSDDGTQCRVIAATPVMLGHKCYQVGFAHGERIVCDEDHLWEVSVHCGDGMVREGVGIYPTRRISRCVTTSSREDRNLSVAVAKPLQIPRNDSLPLDPYILGAWLGDGDSDCSRITCHPSDEQLIGNLVAAGVECHKHKSSLRWRMGLVCQKDNGKKEKLNTMLRRMGLLHNKHIPKEYLRSSEIQRLSLLQGLMDTDGSCSDQGQCEFTSTNQRLAEGAFELVASLGVKAHFGEGRATINGRYISPKYRVEFKAFADLPVFRLSRKYRKQLPTTHRLTPNGKRAFRQKITSIDQVESVPVRCISVDSPSQMYLCGRSMIPTHNSPIAAGIANLCFLFDEPVEHRAEVYAVATKEKQARIVWEEAKNQIAKSTSPSLRKMVVRQTKNMHVPATMSKFEPLGSDSDTNDGWNIHCAVLDELHAWGNHHRGLLNVIETAMGKRRQPLRVMITTAGTDDSQIWIEEYDWAASVAMGQQQADDLFAYIAEVDKDEPCQKCEGADGGCEFCEKTGRVDVDVTDERYWPQANPMLNEPESTVKIDELRSFAARAKVQPARLAEFRRYYANQRIHSYSREITAELWAKGNRPVGDLAGRACHGGFDYGHKRDLASLALVFPMDDGEYHVKVWAFAPREGGLDFNSEPWASFLRNGNLIVNDGDTVDPGEIYKVVEHVRNEYSLQTMAFDPAQAYEFGTKCLNEYGIATFKFPQTCQKYNEPMDCLLELLRQGKFVHGGDPLLTFAATNMVVRMDSMGRRMPYKPKSTAKIDPAVATYMALSECKFSERTETVTVYEREARGFYEF